jgi:hypothetical protein
MRLRLLMSLRKCLQLQEKLQQPDLMERKWKTQRPNEPGLKLQRNNVWNESVLSTILW